MRAAWLYIYRMRTPRLNIRRIFLDYVRVHAADKDPAFSQRIREGLPIPPPAR